MFTFLRKSYGKIIQKRGGNISPNELLLKVIHFCFNLRGSKLSPALSGSFGLFMTEKKEPVKCRHNVRFCNGSCLSEKNQRVGWANLLRDVFIPERKLEVIRSTRKNE
jgi:hypothetical protein